MFPGWRGVTAADPGLRCATASRQSVIPQFLPTDWLVHGFDPASERVDLLPVDLRGILIHRHRGTAVGRIEEGLDEQHFFRGGREIGRRGFGDRRSPVDACWRRRSDRGPLSAHSRAWRITTKGFLAAGWAGGGTGCARPAASGRIRPGRGSVPGGWSCRPSAPAWEEHKRCCQVFVGQRDALFGAVRVALDDLVGRHAAVFGAALVVLDVFPAAGVELTQRDGGGGADGGISLDGDTAGAEPELAGPTGAAGGRRVATGGGSTSTVVDMGSPPKGNS